MERTIKVTGKGRLLLKPDLIRLLINLEGVYERYEEVLQKSAEQTQILRDCFKSSGFADSDLKTLSFHINVEYENYRDKKSEWKKRFAGYKFIHNMKLEFEADNQLLGEVLYALAHCPVRPEFRIVYAVKDEAAAKNQLLAQAVRDSRQKAEVLAQAAKVSLGDIMNIDYSWEEISFAVSSANRIAAPYGLMESDCADCEINIEPDEIEVSDTVTVIWKIE